ncbi:MAG TPA: hypothetical protein VFR23_25350 [Jiangellaceae bacterium]|nr:hypothetical protein [Jiangellaceae bacterium]
MSAELWHCEACGDDMPAKYQRSHPVLCELISRLIAPRIERLVEEIEEATT